MNQVPNFMTFDIEEWYRVNYEGVDAAALTCPPGWMERLTEKLLEICAESGSGAPFLCLARWRKIIRN